MTHRIAVAVLTQAPLPGRCKQHLLGAYDAKWAANLHAAMLRDTLDGLQSIDAHEWVVFVEPPAAGDAAAKDAGDEATMLSLKEAAMNEALEVLARHVPSPWELVPARGEDRATRTQHAFATLFERGADVVLVSGSSAPSFPVDPIATGCARLLAERGSDPGADARRGNVLLGATGSGHCYLVGLDRPEPRLLDDTPWDTEATVATLRARSRDLGLDVLDCEEWYEVDDVDGVSRLLEEMRAHPERAPRTAQFIVTYG